MGSKIPVYLSENNHCINTKSSVSVCTFPYSDRKQGNQRQRENKVLMIIAGICHFYSLLQRRVLEYFMMLQNLFTRRKTIYFMQQNKRF